MSLRGEQVERKRLPFPGCCVAAHDRLVAIMDLLNEKDEAFDDLLVSWSYLAPFVSSSGGVDIAITNSSE